MGLEWAGGSWITGENFLGVSAMIMLNQLLVHRKDFHLLYLTWHSGILLKFLEHKPWMVYISTQRKGSLGVSSLLFELEVKKMWDGL
jgi:hypothetical protein